MPRELRLSLIKRPKRPTLRRMSKLWTPAKGKFTTSPNSKEPPTQPVTTKGRLLSKDKKPKPETFWPTGPPLMRENLPWAETWSLPTPLLEGTDLRTRFWSAIGWLGKTFLPQSTLKSTK